MARLTAGTHEVEVRSVALGTTGSGKEQIGIEFANEAGDSITWYGYFHTDGAYKYTCKILLLLGWDPVTHRWAMEKLVDEGAINGAKASIEVEDEEYQGKTTAKVKWINLPGSSGMRNKMDKTDAERFAERLRRRYMGDAPKIKTADEFREDAAKGEGPEMGPDDDFNLDSVPF